jgi:hypothetical protein
MYRLATDELLLGVPRGGSRRSGSEFTVGAARQGAQA